MLFSLILPTIGRKNEIIEFIDSLAVSAKAVDDKVELIIIDQNDKEFGLENTIRACEVRFKLIYIHSEKKGLSYNRNAGLRLASGNFVGFPDDDCTYYPTTLLEVLNFFRKSPESDFVVGQITDEKTGEKIIKNWPSVTKKVTKINYYFLASSITIFTRLEDTVFFDTDLGAGARFGSCEDPDFLYKKIKANKLGLYSPKIHVWHPSPDLLNIDNKKVMSYAMGFGFFIRKNISFIHFLFLCLLVIKKIYQLVFHYKKFKINYFSYYFRGLYMGLKASDFKEK